MKKLFLAAAVACSLVMVGKASAAGDPPGNAYGYWAGKLCDLQGFYEHNGHVVAAGTTYWESRNYADRGSCVALEGQSLRRGEWSTADWGL